MRGATWAHQCGRNCRHGVDPGAGLSAGTDKPVHNLSYGQKKRVYIGEGWLLIQPPPPPSPEIDCLTKFRSQR